jgi:hypothetical protein
MANKNDLDFTYSTPNEIFRMSIGEQCDFSGARYKGNYLHGNIITKYPISSFITNSSL